ncbi:phage portal protein, partial [Enterococcus faecalis]
SKLTAIYGHAYKLLYQNEEAETCVTYLKPTQGFIVYADDLLKAPMFAVLYNKMTKDELTATVYPQNSTETFIFTQDKTSKRLETKRGPTVFQKALSYLLGGKEAIANPYGEVPMIEFMENDERQGRIESVWSLINNYNEALSEKANDVSYFADAYLKMIGVDLADENVAAYLRDNRVINSPDPLNEGETVDINFLDKPSSDTTQENLLDRLERLIYQMSMTYNANDESFSNNASGISLEFKMQNPRNLAQAKARKFKKGYAQMYKMIFSLPTNVPA